MENPEGNVKEDVKENVIEGVTEEGTVTESRAYKSCNKKKTHYRWCDYFMGAMLLLAAKFYVSMLMPSQMTTAFVKDNNLVLFTLLLLAAGLGYLFLNKRKLSKESMGSTIIVLLALGWFLMKYTPGNQYWEFQDISLYMFLFLHGAGVYWVLSIGTSRLYNGVGEKSIIDMARGFFGLPFLHVHRLIGLAVDLLRRIDIRRGGRDGAKTLKHKQIYLGILASIPVLCVVLPMLASADKSFEVFLSGTIILALDVFYSLFDIDNLLWNLLTLLVGSYLFGLFYGSFYAKPPKPPKNHMLPFAGLITFLSVICGVYLLFFAVKLVDAVGVIVSGNTGVVYSQYAREGFFELCYIAIINFCLYCGVKIVSNPAHRAVRMMQTILCAQTLCFIGLAFSKMSLYISVYGFTFKRVLTSWLMCVLFFLFTLLIGGLWKRRDAIGPAVIFASITFLMLAYSNMDYWMLWMNSRMGVV